MGAQFSAESTVTFNAESCELTVENDEDAALEESESDSDEDDDDDDEEEEEDENFLAMELVELENEAMIPLEDLVRTHEKMMEVMHDENADEDHEEIKAGNNGAASTQTLLVPHFDQIYIVVTPNSPFLVGVFKVAGDGWGEGYGRHYRLMGLGDNSRLGAAVINTGDAVFGSRIDVINDLVADMERIVGTDLGFNSIDVIDIDCTGRYIYLYLDSEDFFTHMLVDIETCSTVRSNLVEVYGDKFTNMGWKFLSDGSCIGYTSDWRPDQEADEDEDEDCESEADEDENEDYESKPCECIYRFFPGAHGIIDQSTFLGCTIRDAESTTIWSNVDVGGYWKCSSFVLSSQDNDPAAVFCVVVNHDAMVDVANPSYAFLHEQTLTQLPTFTAPPAPDGLVHGKNRYGDDSLVFEELYIHSVANGAKIRTGYFASPRTEFFDQEWCLSADLQHVIIWNDHGIVLKPAFHDTINKQFLSLPDSEHFLVGPWTPGTIISATKPVKVFREHSIFVNGDYAVQNLMTGEHLFQLPTTGEEGQDEFRIECTSNAILMFYTSGSVVRVPFGGTGI